jgi:uncharacterized protein (TIGR03083 family)
VSALLAGLAPADLERPTRLPPWDVAHLVAHVYRAFERIPDSLAQPPASRPPEADAATYWRAYERDDGSTQPRADSLVEQFGHEGVVAAFDGMWQRAADLLDGVDGATVVETWGPAMRIDDYTATRLVEVVIHGLDLADALDRPAVAAPDAVALVAHMLTALHGAPVPAALEWSQLEFVEKAAGRADLTPVERQVLGEQSARFPVLY